MFSSNGVYFSLMIKNYLPFWLGCSPLKCPKLAVSTVCMPVKILFSNLFKVLGWGQCKHFPLQLFFKPRTLSSALYNANASRPMVLEAVPAAVSDHIITSHYWSRNQEQKEESNDSQCTRRFSHHLTEQRGYCRHFWWVKVGKGTLRGLYKPKLSWNLLQKYLQK